MDAANNQHFDKQFRKVLQQLNPAQRQAVEQIEGPVLVVAGPGTGKTHILAARIGQILLQTDTDAGNILCLTFTDAGVLAMRNRLIQLIGPEAHKVHIYTFHSFCNAVIQDHLELFGRHDLKPIDDLERIEMIRQLLDELPYTHPLMRNQSSRYFHENHLHRLFQVMKREAWSPDFMLERIDIYLQQLPQNPDFIYKRRHGPYRKGDLKEHKIRKEQERMERLRVAVRLFHPYQQAMKRAQRYDYEDMILWVRQAFDDHPYVLRSYQEKYLYFLVDEYQDTNGAQNDILQRLIAFWDQPNIFIVGDDDQSIYEFQGARLKNMTDFYQQYQHQIKVFVLQENYRSAQPLLDSAGRLIGKNKHRLVYQLQDLGINKMLVASNPEVADLPVYPEIVEYPNRIQELTGILQAIEAWSVTGRPLSKIAVVYAQHRQALLLMAVLDRRGIPYTTRRQINILDLPLIRQLRTILKYLQQESQAAGQGEDLLYHILHFPCWGIAPSDLARLSLQVADQPQKSWRFLLQDAEPIDRLTLPTAYSLRRAGSTLEQLIQDAVHQPILQLLERALNLTGLLEQAIYDTDRTEAIQVLHTFFQFVRSESFKNPRLDLGRLLQLLDRMDANRLALRLNQEIDTGMGVQLLTAHSAKGLEFDEVFILDAISNFWEPSSTASGRFPLPDTLTYSFELDELEARRRLFYVAMTRARSGLHISYAREEGGKALERTRFIDELLTSSTLKVEERSVPAEAILKLQGDLLSEPPPRAPQPDSEQLAGLLQNFKLSISSLLAYQRCPVAFYYEYVLRAPVASSEAAQYGTAMHLAIQRYFERMLQHPRRQFPDRRALVQLFEQEMKKAGARLSAAQYPLRLEQGKEHLGRYYDHWIKQWSRNCLVEYTIRNVELDGVPLTGTIDRIDYLQNGKVHLVDYKTGKPSKKKVDPPNAGQALGANYWQQMVFYQLLFEQFDREGRKVDSGILSFFEPDERGSIQSYTIRPNSEQLMLIRQHIVDTYRRIQNQEFYEGCGKEDCTWCRLIRESKRPLTFTDRDIEALDDEK